MLKQAFEMTQAVSRKCRSYSSKQKFNCWYNRNTVVWEYFFLMEHIIFLRRKGIQFYLSCPFHKKECDIIKKSNLESLVHFQMLLHGFRVVSSYYLPLKDVSKFCF